MLPAAASAAPSLRWMLRSVGAAFVLQAEIREPGPAQRQPDVAGEAVRPAVHAAVGPPAITGAEQAAANLDAAAGAGVLQQEIQHARYRVRAVLRRRPVTEHLHLPQGDGWNDRDVGPLRAVRHTVAAPVDHRRAVTALAVHQHQRMVGRQVAQIRRPDDDARVADRLRVDVERRHDGPQLIAEVRVALADDFPGRDGVDRHRRGGHRAWPRAAADYHHFFLELRPGGIFRGLLLFRAYRIVLRPRFLRLLAGVRRGRGKRGDHQRQQQRYNPHPRYEPGSRYAISSAG